MEMMSDKPNQSAPQPPAAGTSQGARRSVPRVTTEVLLAGGRELVIQHRSEEYRLRLTSNGKLILTK